MWKYKHLPNCIIRRGTVVKFTAWVGGHRLNPIGKVVYSYHNSRDTLLYFVRNIDNNNEYLVRESEIYMVGIHPSLLTYVNLVERSGGSNVEVP